MQVVVRSGDALAKANAVMIGILAGQDLWLAEVGGIMSQAKGLCR